MTGLGRPDNLLQTPLKSPLVQGGTLFIERGAACGVKNSLKIPWEGRRGATAVAERRGGVGILTKAPSYKKHQDPNPN